MRRIPARERDAQTTMGALAAARQGLEGRFGNTPPPQHATPAAGPPGTGHDGGCGGGFSAGGLGQRAAAASDCGGSRLLFEAKVSSVRGERAPEQTLICCSCERGGGPRQPQGRPSTACTMPRRRARDRRWVSDWRAGVKGPLAGGSRRGMECGRGEGTADRCRATEDG